MQCTAVRAQLCLVVQNGFNISTVSPNKGLALDLKKLIMSSSDPVPGGALFDDVMWHRSLPCKALMLTRVPCFWCRCKHCIWAPECGRCTGAGTSRGSCKYW